ncbi:MAG TPA: flavin reductase family protein [Herpetosiphonaceae bacterium]
MDQQLFRQVLGQFPSGVTIVTTCHDGTLHGITVSSFCSLSLDPPLVLVCIDQKCRAHTLIQQSDVFAVNILAEDGAGLSQHFASRCADKFADVPHYLGETGAPLLERASATIECRLANLLPGGDHTIFVGRVVAAKAYTDIRPLLYHKSGYHRLAEA